MLRNYYALRSLYESDGIDTIHVWGEDICLHDLLRGIQDLPPRTRQAIYLTYVEDNTQRQVAEIMGLTSACAGSTIGVYCRRGLKRLLRDYWQ